MRVLSRSRVALLALAGFLAQSLFGAAAWAQTSNDEVYGQAYDNQIALQKGATEMARNIKTFDDALLIISFATAGFILLLLPDS